MTWKTFLEENDTIVCFEGHRSSKSAHGFKISEIVSSMRHHIYRGYLKKAQMCLMELWMFHEVIPMGGQVIGNWLADMRKMIVEWCMSSKLIIELSKQEDSLLEETLTLESLLSFLEKLIESVKSKRVYLYQEWATTFPGFLETYKDIFACPESKLFQEKWVSWSEKLCRKESFDLLEDKSCDMQRRIYQCRTLEELCEMWVEIEKKKVNRQNQTIFQTLFDDYHRVKRRLSLTEACRYTSYLMCCLEDVEMPDAIQTGEPIEESDLDQIDVESVEESYRQSIEWEKKVDWIKKNTSVHLEKKANPKKGWQHSCVELCELVTTMVMYLKNQPRTMKEVLEPLESPQQDKQDKSSVSKKPKPAKSVKTTKARKSTKPGGFEIPLWAAKDELQIDTTYIKK